MSEEETSRRERSCRLADHPERGQMRQYKRVYGEQSQPEGITSGLPVKRPI